MIPQGANGCGSEFLPATDSYFNQRMKRKACAKDFAVVRHLKKALLIDQGVIIYLMEAKFSVTCTQVKYIDFAEWLWWMNVPSCLELKTARPCKILPDVAELGHPPCSSL